MARTDQAIRSEGDLAPQSSNHVIKQHSTTSYRSQLNHTRQPYPKVGEPERQAKRLRGENPREKENVNFKEAEERRQSDAVNRHQESKAVNDASPSERLEEEGNIEWVGTETEGSEFGVLNKPSPLRNESGPNSVHLLNKEPESLTQKVEANEGGINLVNMEKLVNLNNFQDLIARAMKEAMARQFKDWFGTGKGKNLTKSQENIREGREEGEGKNPKNPVSGSQTSMESDNQASFVPATFNRSQMQEKKKYMSEK